MTFFTSTFSSAFDIFVNIFVNFLWKAFSFFIKHTFSLVAIVDCYFIFWILKTIIKPICVTQRQLLWHFTLIYFLLKQMNHLWNHLKANWSMSITITFAFYFINYVSSSQVDHSYFNRNFILLDRRQWGPIRSVLLVIIGWLVGWLVGW